MAMTRRRMAMTVLSAAMLAIAAGAVAGWQDTLRGVLQGGGTPGGGGGTAALTQGEMSGGLKEALAQGVEWSVNALGREDGFLGDERVRIPMPKPLRMVEQGARALGQDRYADEFITTMNRAAERAVPEAASILADAIRAMTVQDAAGILSGPDDAATRYFRRTSGETLEQRFLPIVREATSRSGVTVAYKNLVGKGGGMMGGLVDTRSLDLDRYVTEKTLDGLFTYIALEEKRIRENPLARGSDLLKKVFGSLN